ncbi:DUF58 domain-containing protein [Herbiconiux sp. L3-i23]|uniref:DUF58 domain-containing protein n=1 Tax=Herbiconiux sp. L3-i23 TaxID=2905871 RepID=UPI002053A64C|nr:DUF58 domain-containing protein [Herbiconiux sp. L3-i23]BDI23782.1 membrane protein [Herbiconiux sp. L3-i23]
MTDGARPHRTAGLPALTVRGWAALALGSVGVIVAYATGWRALLYVGLVLLVLVLASLLFVGTRGVFLTVQRQVAPDALSVGQVATVSVTIRNESLIPSPPASWRDEVPFSVSHDFRELPALSGRGWSGDSSTVVYRAVAQQRGRFTIGPLSVRGSDAFGLCLLERATGGVDELIVLPRILTLEGALAAPVALSDATIRAAMMGRGQDDVIARDYRPGDALRHVHWRATAHRGELMVRQEQRHDDARAVLILDNRREHWRSAGAFEWAVSFAASIINHLSAEGTGVALVTTVPDHDGAAHEMGAVSDGSAREALLRLATIGRRSAATSALDYHLRVAELQTDGPSPLFVITGSMDEAEWRELAIHRAPHSHGAAIIVDAAEAPELLWAAGWRCVAVGDPGADMAAVWRSASTGASRV